MFLKSKAVLSPDVININDISEIISRELRMDTTIRCATSRMQTLFILYITVLSNHGLSWITDSNQDLAVGHVLATIRPASLRKRLEYDMRLSKSSSLKIDFRGFMDHATKLSEAFQLVDIDELDNENKKLTRKHKNDKNNKL